MMPFYEQAEFTLIKGDCVEVMRAMPDNSADSFVVDPPYGIRFMGKAWDGADMAKRYNQANKNDRKRARTGAAAAGKYSMHIRHMRAFQEWTHAWAVEAFRMLKPGGHLVSFASTRTYHRMTVGIEDAGFEIRDQIAWTFGSGFPKSFDVSKALDRAAGQERPVIGTRKVVHGVAFEQSTPYATGRKEIAVTEAARRMDGWGTALKPGWEPICLARKPLDGTVAENVAKWGTGALNINGCRIPAEKMVGDICPLPRPGFSTPCSIVIAGRKSMLPQHQLRIFPGKPCFSHDPRHPRTAAL